MVWIKFGFENGCFIARFVETYYLKLKDKGNQIIIVFVR